MSAVLLGVLGVLHGLFAGIMFALVLDSKTKQDQSRHARRLLVWYITTGLFTCSVARMFSTAGWNAFAAGTLLAAFIAGTWVYATRPRLTASPPPPPGTAWPLQSFFESSVTKGIGVLLTAVSAVVAYQWSAGGGAVLCVVGTVLWGGGDVLAGARRLVLSQAPRPQMTHRSLLRR